MSTKTKPPLFDYQDLALRMVDGDPEALTRLQWAKELQHDNAAEHRAKVLALILACEERHAPELGGLNLTPKMRSERLASARYRFCEQVLEIDFRLTTCNVLPISKLQRCLEAAQRERRRLTESADLASLDATDPEAGRRAAA